MNFFGIPLSNESNKLYDSLGLQKNATTEEIKKAYKKLALQCHPDKKPNDKEAESQFHNIQEAYGILTDTGKRRIYDMTGNTNNIDQVSDATSSLEEFINAFAGIDDMLRGCGSNINQNRNGSPHIFVQVHDIKTQQSFTDTPSMSKFHPIPTSIPKIPKNQVEPTKDYMDLYVTLNDLYHRKKKIVKYKVKDLCKRCNGTSAMIPNDIITCFDCLGTGDQCLSCYGQGKMFTTTRRCPECRDGLVEKNEKLHVLYPAGVPDGHIEILVGKGNYCLKSHKYNDISLCYKHKLNPEVLIKDNVLYFPVNITLAEVMCGYKKTVSIGNQSIELNMNGYKNPTENLIYHNRGIPKFKSNNDIGDLIIKINVIYPKHDDTQLIKFQPVLKKIFNVI
jgi:molecular chaperone DnaJ